MIYIVRLRNHNGAIVDGDIYRNASSKVEALKMYKARCYRLGIEKCVYDYYTIDEVAEI